MNVDELGRCGACGSVLAGVKPKRSWESRMAPYLFAILGVALVVAALLYFRVI